MKVAMCRITNKDCFDFPDECKTSENNKALGSWILRPFSGWRYCFHEHFVEIRDSLKRDNRHSD